MRMRALTDTIPESRYAPTDGVSSNPNDPTYWDQEALDNFKLGHLKLDAQASAIALTARASADLAYRNGVAIVTMAKGGLMYEASVGGQKFSFKPVAKGS